MASATHGDFHIDNLLTQISIAYRPQGFIADQIFPVVPVNKESNVFAKIDKGNWLRIPDTLRAPRSAAKEVSYTVSSDTYRAKNYALAGLVDFETIANADGPYDPRQQNVLFLRDQLAMDFEARVQSLVFSNVGSSLTAGFAWSDFANSDPVGDCETGINAIFASTGFTPNVCVMPRKTWQKMRRHPDVVKLVFPGAGIGGMVNLQQFGDVIGVEKVLVPQVIQNTADEGQADTFSEVWSTSVFLGYIAKNPGLNTPTFGYAFNWRGENIGSNLPTGFQVQTKVDDNRGVEIVRTGYYQDEKIVAAELGFAIATGI